MAVAQGFEPWEVLPSHAFEACSLGRSDTLPATTIPAARAHPDQSGTGRAVPDHRDPAGLRSLISSSTRQMTSSTPSSDGCGSSAASSPARVAL